MSVVRRNPARVAPELAQRFASYGVATIHEAQGRKGLLQSFMRPVWPRAKAVGTAVTVSIPPGDNWMFHVAVEQCRAGDILVVAPTSPSDAGYFGELLACSLAARGVVGLVTETGCRDVAALHEMGFPVWSRAISAQGTVKETIGSVNLPVVIAGQLVAPGDLVCADDDGVVVVRRAEAEAVLKATEAREAKENATRARLKAGELGLDIYGMREALAKKGLRYEDAPGDADG
ncbi:4-carboxy-4-hydroxy-2-oxoadipate aldolase/oxaloacetate decarboxylase [Falsiroseomonas oryziterrae]|uniref:4-carboxy-4-hydroxy-2-oxoadipate aldolase/oxaloacetate decarboxylase n=1 Tax=Falsiroseomonas oryziterrae TaxID=2911368 RepID=UPI001F006602|nr:4-carboxy-4-hydroxy-2-oxoadipate aldolase/oxaloacetate decarboxylase [Roseomonas sp. NPKOSM-4]